MLDPFLALDTSLFLRINELPHPDWLTAGMWLASAAGNAAAIWILLGLLLLVRHTPGVVATGAGVARHIQCGGPGAETDSGT